MLGVRIEGYRGKHKAKKVALRESDHYDILCTHPRLLLVQIVGDEGYFQLRQDEDGEGVRLP